MMHVFILNVNAGKNNSYLIGKIIEEYCKLQRVNYFVNYSYTKEDTEQIVNKYKSLDDVVIYSVGAMEL